MTSRDHRIIIHHMSSEVEDEKNVFVPRAVIFLNIVFRPTIGALMALRGLYDGRISVVSLLLSILYFTGFIIVIFMDKRFEHCERFSRLIPKVFGIAVAGVQLAGSLPLYSCNTDVEWRTCI